MSNLKNMNETLLAKIKEEVSESIFELWFQDLKIIKLTESAIFMSVESDVQLLRIRDKYMDQMKFWIKECFDLDMQIKLYHNQFGKITDEELERDAAEIRKNAGNDSGVTFNRADTSDGGANGEADRINEIIVQKNDNIQPGKNDIIYDGKQNFKLDYTFENFVVGNSNRFTFTACTDVAKYPASRYNPLFIYAPPGLGKTHLLYAITNEYAKNYGNAKIIYVKGEEFTNQLINSLSERTSNYFREKYRNADILLVDDIQFIAGKNSTQEEFFHTFNSLYESKKQIVLTSDCPPRDIKLLEDRLTSRFESGLITDIQPPDLELRIAILKQKAKDMDIDVSNDVLLFLAENITSNIRQIEGAIKKLNAYAFLNNSQITVDLARACILDILSGTEPVNVTVEKVLNLVASKYNVPVEEIKGRKRTQDIATARHISIYILRKITDMSLPSIGKIYGRDHSTIISAIDSITEKYNNDGSIRVQVDDIIKMAKS